MPELKTEPIPLCTIGICPENAIREARLERAAFDLATFARSMRFKIPAETREFLHWWVVGRRREREALSHGEEILTEGLERGRGIQGRAYRSAAASVILGWEIENVFQELIYQRRNATVADKQHFPVQVESFYVAARAETVFLLAFRFIDRTGTAVYAVPVL